MLMRPVKLPIFVTGLCGPTTCAASAARRLPGREVCHVLAEFPQPRPPRDTW